MSSEETEAASPPCGSHRHGAKGLWALGGLTVSTVVGHRTDPKPYAKRWVEAVDKPRVDGAYVHQHLNFISFGKIHGRKAKASNRTMGNPAVRHYRGASGNVAMVEMRSHLAIERARLVTLHLQQARRSSIPTKHMETTYKMVGIDVHKGMLAVVVVDAAAEGEFQFERRKFGASPARPQAG